MSTSPTTISPLTLSPEERDLILSLRSQQETPVVTAHPAYIELLTCCNRDVSEAMTVLSRTNNILTYLNAHTVAAPPAG